VAKTVSYFYNADGNRGGDAHNPGLQIPGYSFFYTYTNRNQLWQIKFSATTPASYVYDQRGNVTTRTLGNSTHSDYSYDGFDRVTSIAHALNEVGTTRTFNYGYDTNTNDRLWTKRLMSAQSPENNKGDVFSYDEADQAMAVELDVLNPDQERQPLTRTISYDANGNRTTFGPLGQSDTYTTNNLNQYTSRNSVNAVYDSRGNLTTGLDGSSYQYDAQNRLISALKNNVSMSFAYDGLNRQVSRGTFQFIAGGTTTYNVWDGWDLVQEYHMSGVTAVEDASYLYGPTGLVKNLKTNNYYYQDGSGSTSHLADSSGHLLEWYRYDLQGTPFFYNASDTQIGASAYSVRHLFTGQQWSSDLGLYDLRNRFYSPDIGRFLQPDPIGFGGGNNLYRHCGNNPVTRRDPSGLTDPPQRIDGPPPSVPTVIVTASVPSIWEDIWHSAFNSGYFGPGPNFLGAQAPSNLIPGNWMIGSRGGYSGLGLGGFGSGWGGTPLRLPENGQLGVEPSLLSSVPSQNPDPPDPRAVAVQQAALRALGLLNPDQIEASNVLPRDENFARVVDSDAINTSGWSTEPSIHGSAVESPVLPGYPDYAVKLYNDPSRGNVIAVVHPTWTMIHWAETVPYMFGIPVNYYIAQAFLNSNPPPPSPPGG
jgi:RHS repeat-associated protein